MDNKLLELELDTFIDWLVENVEEPYQFDLTEVGEGLLSKYMLDRPNFINKQKEIYPALYADIILK